MISSVKKVFFPCMVTLPILKFVITLNKDMFSILYFQQTMEKKKPASVLPIQLLLKLRRKEMCSSKKVAQLTCIVEELS